MRRSPARRSSARSARCSAYETLEEAIALANGTRYGLQAGIFTARSPPRFVPPGELEFGGVTVNEAPTFRADQMPYGGVKDSGNTREGPAWAVREMTEERLVVVQRLSRARTGAGGNLTPMGVVLERARQGPPQATCGASGARCSCFARSGCATSAG